MRSFKTTKEVGTKESVFLFLVWEAQRVCPDTVWNGGERFGPLFAKCKADKNIKRDERKSFKQFLLYLKGCMANKKKVLKMKNVELSKCCIITARMILEKHKDDFVSDLAKRYTELFLREKSLESIDENKFHMQLAVKCVGNHIDNLSNKKGGAKSKGEKTKAAEKPGEGMNFASKTILTSMKKLKILQSGDKFVLRIGNREFKFVLDIRGSLSFSLPGCSKVVKAISLASAVYTLVKEGVIEIEGVNSGKYNSYAQPSKNVTVIRGDESFSLLHLKRLFFETDEGKKILMEMDQHLGKEKDMEKFRIDQIQRKKDGRPTMNIKSILQKKDVEVVEKEGQQEPTKKKDKGKGEKKLQRSSRVKVGSTMQKMRDVADREKETEERIKSLEKKDLECGGEFSSDEYDDVGGHTEGEGEESGYDSFVAQDDEDIEMEQEEYAPSCSVSVVQTRKKNKRKRRAVVESSDDEDDVGLRHERANLAREQEWKEKCVEEAVQVCKGGKDVLAKILLLIGCYSAELYVRLSDLGLENRSVLKYVSNSNLAEIESKTMSHAQKCAFVDVAHNCAYQEETMKAIARTFF
jgi:hypothetical protein